MAAKGRKPVDHAASAFVPASSARRKSVIRSGHGSMPFFCSSSATWRVVRRPRPAAAHRHSRHTSRRSRGPGSLVTTVEALTHQFVIHKPEARDGERDRFIDEVTRLVVGYLMPGRR